MQMNLGPFFISPCFEQGLIRMVGIKKMSLLVKQSKKRPALFLGPEPRQNLILLDDMRTVSSLSMTASSLSTAF